MCIDLILIYDQTWRSDDDYDVELNIPKFDFLGEK